MFAERRLKLSQLNLYGREKEFAELQKVYERVQMGSAETVFVKGDEGVGKKWLVERICLVEDCYFVSRKLEHDESLQSVVQLLGDLIESICEDEKVHEAILEAIVDDMTEDEILILALFIPAFSDYLADTDEDTDYDWYDQPESFTLRMRAVRNLLRIISNEVGLPVTLCVYDLHLADEQTIEFLEYIAHGEDQECFLFIATMCQGDVLQNEKLRSWEERAKLCTKSNPLHIVTFKELNFVEVNSLLSDIIDLDEGETFPLATLLYTRTNGNMLYLKQLLEYWQNEKMLVFDTFRCRWTWELPQLRNTALSDHVVDLVASRIQRHPLHVQRVLILAAVMGYKVDPDLLKVCQGLISPNSNIDILSTLEFCVQERLMERSTNGKFRFFHHRIRQVILDQLPNDKALGMLHLRIGTCLWTHAKVLMNNLHMIDDKLLFMSTDNLLMGSQQGITDTMKVELVQLISAVGKKAAGRSAFASAAKYVRRGIELLDEMGQKWEKHGSLCMSLYVSYAILQYKIGESHECLHAIQEVLAHDPSPSDKLKIKLLHLRVLKSSCCLGDFISLSISLLEEFGEQLPKLPSNTQQWSESQKVKKLLHMKSEEDILALPQTKSVVLEVLLGMLIPLETLGQCKLASIVACRAIRLSITIGITKHSPEAFAIYGVYLICQNNDIVEGCKYGDLAVKLSEKVDPNRCDAKVLHWVNLCIRPWQMLPLALCADSVFQGHVTAMKQGDPFVAFKTIDAYFTLSFCSSLNLRPLLRDIENYSTQMLEYGQKLVFLQVLPIWQCVLNLSGESRDTLDMSKGTAMDHWHTMGNEFQVGKCSSTAYQMQLAFYMGDMELARSTSKELQEGKLGTLRLSRCLYPTLVFFFGLIAIETYRSTGKRKDKTEALRHIDTMRQWVEKKAGNLVHKLMLLQAEFSTLGPRMGDGREELQRKYDKAISAARKSGFLQDAALGTLLAGKMLLNRPQDSDFATPYLVRAHLLYKSWGAIAVADKVKHDYVDVWEVSCSSICSMTSTESEPDDIPRLSYRSRERFDKQVSLLHQRELSEESTSTEGDN